MKTVIAISCTIPFHQVYGYIELATTLLKSILKNNPGFDLDFYVITNDSFKEEWKAEFNKIYDKVKFWVVDEELYHKSSKYNVRYYSIECFNLPVDRVIFTGADVLCLNSLDDLLALTCDMGMGREKRRPEQFSNGTMVIGKKYINKETYRSLLAADFKHVKGIHGSDMKHYNCFFKGQITEIEHRFNVTTTEVDFTPLSKAVFLHFVYKTNASRITPEVLALWKSYRDLKLEDLCQKKSL